MKKPVFYIRLVLFIANWVMQKINQQRRELRERVIIFRQVFLIRCIHILIRIFYEPVELSWMLSTFTKHSYT